MNMIIENKYFLNIGNLVNCDSYNSIPAISTKPIIEINNFHELHHAIKITEQIKNVGFAIIRVINEHLSADNLNEKLITFLDPLLSNNNLQHKPFSVVKSDGEGKYYINSHLAQPMHTDEGYTRLSPRYVALYCQRQSIKGGDSILVPFQKLYKKLIDQFQDDVALLFDQECISITHYHGEVKKPILCDLENGSIGISYSPVLKKLCCNKKVYEMFDFITSYVHTPSNQIRFLLQEGDILLFDNFKILHGRTRFAQSDPRLLYRYWFNYRIL